MIDEGVSLAQRIYTPQGVTKESLDPLRVLHLGCGLRKIKDATGVDRLALPGVDVVHDLQSIPWPFPDDSFDAVVLHSVLEHLQPFVSIMDEIHRVGRPGARVIITVPYFRCVDAFSDPTHVAFFTSSSMSHILEGEKGAGYTYTARPFRQIGFWYGWPQPSHNPVVRLLKSIAYRHPGWYDQYLSMLLPFKVLIWELSVLK